MHQQILNFAISRNLQTHTDAASRDHGLFFLRAMIKNEYPVIFTFHASQDLNTVTIKISVLSGI